MSILLTGFEPFDGASVNPSWEAVQRVPDQICGHEVHRLRLPVVYGQAAAPGDHPVLRRCRRPRRRDPGAGGSQLPPGPHPG